MGQSDGDLREGDHGIATADVGPGLHDGGREKRSDVQCNLANF